MELFKAVTITSSVFTALCLLGLPLWILGVPGVKGNYADGWAMGLNALLLYIPAWFIIYAPYFVMHKRLGATVLLQWQAVTGWIAAIVLFLAIARLVQAFIVMK